MTSSSNCKWKKCGQKVKCEFIQQQHVSKDDRVAAAAAAALEDQGSFRVAVMPSDHCGALLNLA